MQARCGNFGFAPEGVIEGDVETMPRCSVEQRSIGHLYLEHFLQADGLSAKLNFIAVLALWPPALVLDRKGLPEACYIRKADSFFGHAMELHHVCDSRQSEAERPERKAPRNPDIAPGLCSSLVDAVVQVLPLDGKSIVRPELLNVDQRALPLAEHQMLQCRQLQQSIFVIHDFFRVCNS